jgi:hypothetical protein
VEARVKIKVSRVKNLAIQENCKHDSGSSNILDVSSPLCRCRSLSHEHWWVQRIASSTKLLSKDCFTSYCFAFGCSTNFKAFAIALSRTRIELGKASR